MLIEPGWYVYTSKKTGVVHELYDLSTDPAEKMNLAKQRPEMVQQLAKSCKDWQQRCGIVDYSEILKIRPNHME